MVKGLVLYSNGTSKVVDFITAKDYQECIGGFLERFLQSRTYTDPKTGKERRLICYADEEGALKGLPTAYNWMILLPHIGLPRVFGNAILFTEIKGEDGDIDDCIVEAM